MKLMITLLAFIPVLGFAVEPTKEEMRQNLKRYVHENKEASVSLAPLIEKLTAILDTEEAKKQKEAAAPQKEVDSLLKK